MDMYDAFNTMANNVSGQLGTQVDVNQVMGAELNNVIDYGLWQETVEIQKRFNDSVAPGWQLDKNHKKYDYWMAILDETVEVLGSKHWKWWKNTDKMGTVDWNNLQVELVDIFHFVLSVAIQNESQHILFSQLVNLEMGRDKLTAIRDDEFFDKFWDEFLMAVQFKNLPLVAVRLVEYWYRSGGDAAQLFMEYRVKSALNDIRQEFGYGAKNSYIKMWTDNETGAKVEDNVIAWRIAKTLELDADTTKNMKAELKKYYLTHVAI